NLAISQTAAATGVLKGIVYTGAVNTNQTLSTEIPSLTLTTAGRQWATGALTTQREVLITQPTYSFVGASTITNAATLGIAGAPIQSTNATITNTHGLLIQAGAVGTVTNAYGLTVNAPTGTGNMYAAAFLGGNVGIGATAPGALLDVLGTSVTLASVSSTPGTPAGNALTVLGQIGGNTTNASGVGGIGGALSLTGGAGGTSSGATTSTGGKGGNLAFTTGAGGAATVTGGTKLGGVGGDFLLSGGLGGNTSGTGTLNTGGKGGSLFLYGGTGGTASGATSNIAGAAGNVLLGINSAGTAIGNVGIGLTNPSSKLQVAGDVQVGSATADGTGNLLLLDNKNTAGDPTGQDGAMYYNSNAKRFRCYENGGWQDCVTSGSVVSKKKASDTNDSGTTFVDATDLSFSVGANETWTFNFVVQAAVSTISDIKFRVNGPASSTCVISFQPPPGANGSQGNKACGVSQTHFLGSSGDDVFEIMGTIATAGTSGTVQLQFGEDTADAFVTKAYAGSSINAFRVMGADLAEVYYTNDDSVRAGDLVKVDGSLNAGVQKTNNAYDSSTLGIISTKPGYVLGDSEAHSGRAVFLALSGRVPVKIASNSAAIQPGDYLTSSDEPGKAMNATGPGATIGKALESWDPASGQTMVLTFVNISHQDGNLLAGLSLDPDGNLILPFNEENAITELGGTPPPAPKKDLGWTLGDIVKRLTKLEEKVASGSAGFSTGSNNNGSSSSELEANREAIENLKLDQDALKDRVASLEADLSLLTTNPYALTPASNSAQLGLENVDTKTATISGTLSVGGRTTLADVGITGRMNIGLLAIEGLSENGFATLNTTSGPLMLQSDGVNGIDILDGKIVIDTEGNMKVNGILTVKKLNIDDGTGVAGASLGEAILPTGTTKITIDTTSVTTKSKIFLTPKTKTSQPLSVTGQINGESFDVETNSAINKDVKFNWWIVN
ncbi:MAG TPA: hypothetical protein VNA13_02700, partial [Xanthomonadales bacterium]|nr:hypothetical protein [Xanthomonadales bacterium]